MKGGDSPPTSPSCSSSMDAGASTADPFFSRPQSVSSGTTVGEAASVTQSASPSMAEKAAAGVGSVSELPPVQRPRLRPGSEVRSAEQMTSRRPRPPSARPEDGSDIVASDFAGSHSFDQLPANPNRGPRRRHVASPDTTEGPRADGGGMTPAASSNGAAARSHGARAELADAARSCGWRLVWAPSSSEEEPVGAEAERPVACIVAADLAHSRMAWQVVKRLRSEKTESIVVVALFLPDKSLDRSSVLYSQMELMSVGADDIVLIMEAATAQLHVEMGIARVRAKQHCMKKLEAKIVAACESELEEQVQELSRKCREPTEGLFWQHAHSILEGVPQLSPELDPSPGTGSTVAGCTLEKQLGHGVFGRVFAARDSDTQELDAIKVIDKSQITDIVDVRSIGREVSYLRSFDHPNIVRFKAAQQGPVHVFIRMELAGRFSLKRAIASFGGRLPGVRCRDLAAQLLGALAYCHGQGAAHRDVKPENIGVSQDGAELKLLDFGSAVPLMETTCDMAGTMPFMAPEILAAGDKEPYVPCGCDVWSAGVVLLEMLCGLGKLDRMVGWGPRHEPSPQRSAELGKYFQEFDLMYESLESDLGVVEDSLMDLFAGIFQLDTTHRTSAKEALRSEWMSGPKPSE